MGLYELVEPVRALCGGNDEKTVVLLFWRRHCCGVGGGEGVGVEALAGFSDSAAVAHWALCLHGEGAGVVRVSIERAHCC